MEPRRKIEFGDRGESRAAEWCHAAGPPPAMRRWKPGRGAFALVGVVVVALSASTAHAAPGDLLFEVAAGIVRDRFGTSVAGLGDVDGDAVPDFVVGALNDRGVVRAFSGADRSILWTTSIEEAYWLGVVLAAVGDIDGDGASEVVVGSTSRGAYLLSGADGHVVRTVVSEQPDDGFGRSVAGPGDLDGDDVPDWVVGARYFDGGAGTNSGRLYVYAGATGALLGTLNGEAGGSLFGEFASGVPDVDGDGRRDLVVAAADFDGGPAGGNAGRVYVFSGATLTPLYALDGDQSGSQFGHDVAGIEDLNGDGRGDLLIGAFGYDTEGGDGAGRIYAYSGADAARLYTIEGRVERECLGFDLDALNDVDDDGVPDFAAGAFNFDSRIGRAFIVSGASGLYLHEFQGPRRQSDFAIALSAVGDLNSDARHDVLIGAPHETSNQQEFGQVSVYASGPSRPCIDADGDGYGTGGHSVHCEHYAIDCDDANAETHPNAYEICNDVDDDCDGYVDEGYDRDVDDVCNRYDNCPDTANPGQEDQDGDHVGDVCDPDVDGDLCPNASDPTPTVPSADLDGDGVGAECDCDDTDPLVSPMAAERCNGADDNCNGEIDEDFDGDGFGPCDGDCDDTRRYVNPGSSEVFGNGLDDDCDPLTTDEGDEGLWQEATDDEYFGFFGWSVSTAGDVDADGVSDYVVGAPGNEAAFVYSGATRALLHRLEHDRGNVGFAVAPLGDFDGDEHADLIVSGNGQAVVYSGATGFDVYTVNSPDAPDEDAFGYSLAGLDDLDGDEVPDFAVGAPSVTMPDLHSRGSLANFANELIDELQGSGERTGRVFLYSGATGTLMDTLEGIDPGGAFGFSLASIEDLDGDSVRDLVVGAPYTGAISGNVYVYSGATRDLIFTRGGLLNRLGYSVAGADLDGDGKPEVIAGAASLLHGAVFAFKGTGGLLVATWNAENVADGFGRAVANAGDFDGDGKEDLLVGAPYQLHNCYLHSVRDPYDFYCCDWLWCEPPGPPPCKYIWVSVCGWRGKAYLFSGANGQRLRVWDGVAQAEGFGFSAAGIGDVSGDGRSDIVVGGPGNQEYTDHSYANGTQSDKGLVRVLIHAGPCVDPDGDGWGVGNLANCAGETPDCDETSPDVNPGAVEIPSNGVDDDCDGEVDEAPSTGCPPAATVPTVKNPPGAAWAPYALAALGLANSRRRRRG